MIGFGHEELHTWYDRLIELIGRGEPTLAPGTLKIPVTDYTARDRWEREVELHRTTPMILAFINELSELGSYWAISRVGVSVILVRSTSGEVRLFLNAVPKRGGKIVEDGKGDLARLTADERGVDLDDLTELAVEERAGLIWGILTPGVSLAVDAFLGPTMSDILMKSGLARFRVIDQIELPAANWKLAFEGYLETYHFKSLHAKSFGSFVIPNILQFNPVEPHGYWLTPAMGIETCDPSSRDDLKRYVQLAFNVFPTTFFAFASDTAFSGAREAGGEPIERLFVNQVLPGDTPDTSITISRTMISADFIGTAIEDETRNWAMMTHQTVRDEDYPVVDTSQATLRSGAQEHLTFGRNEIVIHHFHQSLRKALGDEPLGQVQHREDHANVEAS